MNSLDFAIITDFQRTKLINECEELSDGQLELINGMADKAYSLISKTDFKSMLSDDENISFYTDVENRVMEVLKNNDLSFTDKRCYNYLLDGVYCMLKSLF